MLLFGIESSPRDNFRTVCQREQRMIDRLTSDISRPIRKRMRKKIEGDAS